MAKSKYRKLVGQLRTADEILSQAYRSISIVANDLQDKLNDLSDRSYHTIVEFELGETLSLSHFLISVVKDKEFFVEAVAIESLNAPRVYEIHESIETFLREKGSN